MSEMSMDAMSADDMDMSADTQEVVEP
jgi:hypothetical protein